MRVLLCNNNYSITGGAEVFYHEVGRILKERGHEVAYFSAWDDKAETDWSRYFPKYIRYDKYRFRSIVQFHKYIYSMDAKRAVKRIVDDFKPHIAHCFAVHSKLTPSVFEGLRERNVMIVCSLNEYKHICPSCKLYHHGHLCDDCKDRHYYHAIVNRCSHDSLMYSTAHAIESYFYAWMNIYRKNVKLFLFASEFMARKTEEYWGKETFAWRLLRNPFNSRKYSLAKSDGGYLLYFGRLTEEKGVDMLIQAMRYVTDARLVIVGDGPQASSLRKLSRELNLSNIEFAGPKWNEEMDVILANARFVVVPSLWHENYPYVINQSFAHGKAVVGSNRGGIPELIKHEQYGLIYDAVNVMALADAIRVLWKDPLRTAAMGKAAKEYSDREFNDDTFYNTLISIYNEVLS